MTGETHPREKSAAAIPEIDEDAGIHDKTNVIFMGTLICSGNCTAVVSTTGLLTEFGKTFQDTRDVEKSKTPLQVICFTLTDILV
jgi:Ca2+-transporting ATPase